MFQLVQKINIMGGHKILSRQKNVTQYLFLKRGDIELRIKVANNGKVCVDSISTTKKSDCK